MPKTTVLFICPDNALLSPLAEAYLNAQAGKLIRGFSAGVSPCRQLHPAVVPLLSEQDLCAEGLVPKSLDVFLMPHAPVPDRVISLVPMPQPVPANAWGGDVPLDVWDVSGRVACPVTREECSQCFVRIRQAIDWLLDPLSREIGSLHRRRVA